MGVLVCLDQFKGYPEYFRMTIHKKIYVHKTYNLFFRLDFDNSIAPSGYPRFVEGCQFFCRRCGEPAVSRFEFIPKYQCWIATRILCHLGCRNAWIYTDDETLLETLEKI